MNDEIDPLAERLLRLPPAYGAHVGAPDRRLRLRRPLRGRQPRRPRTRRSPRPGRFAARAEAIDEAGSTSSDRITRAMLVCDASSRAELLDGAHSPSWRPTRSSACRPPRRSDGHARRPRRRTSPRRWSAKFAGVGRHFDELAERHREGVAPGRTPAEFAVRADRRAARRAGSRRRRRRPAARPRAGPPDGRRRRRAGARGCWPSCESRCGPAGRALPRRAARRGRCRTRGPTSSAA